MFASSMVFETIFKHSKPCANRRYRISDHTQKLLVRMLVYSFEKLHAHRNYLMNKIAICSLFRDNVADVNRVFVERAKWQYDQAKIIHICIEGDSQDDTYQQLTKISGFKTIVEKIDQGTVKVGSYAEPGRLQALAQLWNRALDIAVCEKARYTFLVDSDISVGPTVIQQLIKHNKSVVAPMLYFDNSIFFRDAWAYHADGNNFTNRYPYHKRFNGTKLFEVDGVGCPMLRYEVIAKGARCDGQEVRGLSQSIKGLGYKIMVDPLAAIYHPRLGQDIPQSHER